MDLSNPTLAITYKDDGNQDGICSQLLRIYGIYAISRLLGVPYFHSPIARLGYHGLAALENNAPLPDLLTDVNRIFHIPSDIEFTGKRVTIHDMVDADIDSIERIRNTGSKHREAHLIRILYPFPVTDPNPELYRHLKAICPFPYPKSEVFRLAIHVRRGELFAVSSDWMLPNAYYVSCALRFQDALRRLGIPFVCELYTEVPSKPFEVTPEHHGIYGRIAENMIFDPAMNHLEDFDAIPNLERFINFDPIESLRRMATADALIISHSSFSYLPAIFNPNRIVVYHPYWRGRMKDWLISDDQGGFPETDLIERLKVWKRAADRDSAAAISRVVDVPQDLYPEIERLLQPFRGQSAEIRSVVAMGCDQILGMTEGAAPLRLVVGEDSGRPNIRVEPIWPAEYTLGSLAEQARELSGSLFGDDLLLLPVRVLNETMTPSAEQFSFRAVAALFSGASGRPGDEHDWKLRRSLFDRGLVCIGAVDFAGGRALCFLASDAVRSFNQLDVESRGYITMTNLLDGAGFGNQLWRYACVKLYALRHGLTPAFPAWQGNQLFGLEDKSCEGFAFPRIDYPGFANNDRELWDRDDPPINIDLAGYFQEIPECWRKHRALLRRMFQLSPDQTQAIDAWRDAVTDVGRRTLVAISVRRGDYYKFQFESFPWFRIVPEEWYLDWLRAIWPTLCDPILFVASDEADNIVPVYREFDPIPATFGSTAQELPHHISDFEVLRRADYLAICNSSFPRFAAILAPSTQKCFLPSFQAQCFVPYQPWMDPQFGLDSRIHGAAPILIANQTGRRGRALGEPALFFEISDLLLSLLHQTGLSGVHRVEWEILCNVLEMPRPEPVAFALLNDGAGIETIKIEALLDIVERMRTGAGIESQVRALLNRAIKCIVRPRDIVIVIGAFWNVSGIGTLLQNLKNSGAITGVFFHDVIPIAAPEFFDPASTRLFVKAAVEALTFADFILTASEYNKASLTTHIGSALDSLPVHVVPLGHGFPLPAIAELSISTAVAGILETDYVLCAGPIEARKNPAYLFNIWKMLLRSGRPNIPHLVFAGRKGWLAEDFMHQLKACNHLEGRILVVHDATDAELDSLYRNCLLTVFPSFVEGWALPVGESLAHGKVCLCSSEGGLPEIGGELVDYVDPYNVRDGLQRLLRYLDDPELRRSRELEIARHFRPRSWRQAADDFLTSTQMLARQARPFEGITAVMVPPGRYVPVGSEAPAIVADKMSGTRSAELMCVSGWHPPEVSGVRASRPTATVRFRTNAAAGTRINLVLRLAADERDFRIRIYGTGAETEVSLAERSNRVAALTPTVEPGELVTVHLLTMGATPVEDGSPGGSYWMLKGILYFDPKSVGAETTT